MTFMATDMVKRDAFEEVDMSIVKDGVIIGHRNSRGP